MRAPLLTATFVCCLATAGGLPAQDRPGGASLPASGVPSAPLQLWTPSAGEKQIREALRTPVSPDFQLLTLPAIVEWLEEEIGIRVLIDREKLSSEGLSGNLESEFSFRLDGIEARAFLARLLEEISCDYFIRDDCLVVTASPGVPRQSRVFDVTGLYVLAAEGRQAPAETPEIAPNELVDVIVSTVTPEAWDVLGGDASVRPAFLGGRCALAVAGSRSVLDAVEELLQDLQSLDLARKATAQPVTEQAGTDSAAASDQKTRSILVPHPADARIQAALQTRISPRFAHSALRDSIAWIAGKVGIPLDIDEAGIAGEGQSSLLEYEDDLALDEVAAGTVLGFLLENKELATTVKYGMLRITMRSIAEGQLEARVYDVGAFVSGESERVRELTQLLDLVTSQVAPDSWDCSGGPCSGRILTLPTGDALIVRQTWANHNRLLAFLESLNRVAVVPRANRPGTRWTSGLPVAEVVVESEEIEPAQPVGPVSREAAIAANALGLRLYHELRVRHDGNLAFSPASAVAALSLALPGAAGSTEDALLQALAPDADRTSAIERLARWSRGLTVSPEPAPKTLPPSMLSTLSTEWPPRRAHRSRMMMANRIWLDRDCPVRPEWSEIQQDMFGAPAGELDFRDIAGSVEAINAWCRKATRGRIPDLVDAAALKTRGVEDGRAAFVLASGMSLWAGWDHPFPVHMTASAIFHSPSGSSLIELMTDEIRCRYAQREDIQGVEIPLGRSTWTMLFLLPSDPEGRLSELESRLTLEFLERLRDVLTAESVRVFLPRFRVQSSFELESACRATGLALPFSMTADFSRMTEQPVYLDSARQRTLLKVGEEGIEASAATALMGGFGGTSDEKTAIVFRADHPFVYLLRDNRSDTILMIGRYVGPEEDANEARASDQRVQP